MPKFEGINKREEFKTMHCSSSEKSIGELEDEGWEEAFSFHATITNQWNSACDLVDSLQKMGDWEVVRLNGQDDIQRKDGVAFLYKKKTTDRLKWEKENGY